MNITYFYVCIGMFALGLILLAVGFGLKDRLPPRLAATMIVVGLGLAMVFMNLALVVQMNLMNG